ncbi:hypothetical protein KPSA1B_101995 [Pseudomonas syringae pv. actinidiae]|uniref:Hemolysin or related protein n=1 Tax=Pseudomonas syringae pv. actinidiae TaxID=103796 RepID=A0A2V0QLL4_PSESF|nr:hypothetical protein KPSA1B_101995 [Pseudomonas syringae pv. actinidiae]GBH11518.1 Hemolysin or related protein [Pseudomonas syringae pv. actinidiae]
MGTSEIEIPTPVLQASHLSFLGGVTGYLYQPQVWGFCLIGHVFFDSKDRFKTGRLIRTSSVREFQDDQGYLIAVTTSGSRYVLIDVDVILDQSDRDEPFDPVAPKLLS